MSSIQDFTNWQEVNEKKLDIDSKSSKKQTRKQKRKSNKRSNRKSTYLSDSGVEFALIKRKSDGDSNTDAYTLKSKNKDSKIWDAKGIITDDVDSFLQDELFGGTTEGKYDEESIELDKYKQGARKDNVKFTVKLVDKEAKKKKEADEAKKKTEEAKKKADVAKKPADLYKAITIPENDEGEKRIEIGQESTVLPEIKDILRKSYIKQGLKLPTNTFGVRWLDTSKLEDIDSQWIKMLRAGFKMKSADYITSGFVKKMVDQANLWNNAPKAAPEKEAKKEAPTEDVASNESSLFSFNGFVKVNEEFDMAAANAVATKPKSEAPKKKKSSSSSSGGSRSSGLTDGQAVAYRTWANTGKGVDKYGKTSKFDLDAKGSNNSFVKRSYTQAKKDRDNEVGIFDGTLGAARRVAFDIIFKEGTSKVADAVNKPTVGEGEYVMGYMQDKLGVKWAIHFALPRPNIGSIKAGEFVSFKNAWTKDENKKFKVLDIWKDKNGKLGAIYVDVPGLSLSMKDGVNRDFENKGIIVKAAAATYKKATGDVVTIKGDYVNVRSSAMANTGTVNNLIKKVTGKGAEIGKIISTKMVTDPYKRIKDHNWYNIEFPPVRTWSKNRDNGWVRDDTVNKK